MKFFEGFSEHGIFHRIDAFEHRKTRAIVGSSWFVRFQVEINNEQWMYLALQLANDAMAAGEVPIGAVLVKEGEVVGRGQNRTLRDCDPTAHAEIIALRDAARTLGNHRLVDTQMYVTIEPCTMCAGALIHARVSELYFGAREPRAGSVVSTGAVLDNESLNHRVKVYEGIGGDECSAVMRQFFRDRRATRRSSKG